MTKRAVTTIVGVLAAGVIAGAQDRPLSPAGTAATQVGGQYVKSGERETYEGGKWIEITYGRPIKRGRVLFGTGADYGQKLNAGAPVWRAGANVSTRLKTEVPLQISGKVVPAGEYSMFVDLKPDNWTLIISSWGAKQTPDEKTPNALWGSYDYTPDKDVARAKMTLTKLPVSIDQLTWGFADVTQNTGKLVLMWDTVMAAVPFAVVK